MCFFSSQNRVFSSQLNFVIIRKLARKYNYFLQSVENQRFNILGSFLKTKCIFCEL